MKNLSVMISFVLLFSLDLKAQQVVVPAPDQQKFDVDKAVGDELLELANSRSDYDEVRCVIVQGKLGGFGINIGFEYFRKGELVRVTHLTRYDSGNLNLKTKSGGHSMTGWTEIQKDHRVLNQELDKLIKNFPLSPSGP